MNTSPTIRKKRQITIVLITGTLLLIPLIAMQYSREVNWSPFDFVVAAFLLLGTGFSLDMVIAGTHNKKIRLLLCAFVLMILALLWAELAVGIFGSPISGS